jgi:tetratricopeptide (TPR) repeat protein
MAQDAQGHTLTGANADAARHIDNAVRAFTLNYGDVNAHLTSAQESAPDCPFADILKAWLRVLSNDPAQIAPARQMSAKMREIPLNEREGNHLEALRLAADGRWPSAVAILDRHLMQFPHDLAAHQCAMRLDGYLGRFHREAGRAARALPFWSKDQPGYGIMTSFYGFGLEELGDYDRAEDISRAAAELEPYGYWPHHAVSHVLEMTGRPDEGVAWMESRLPFWSDPKCNNRVHIWWHKALFHIELGQYDKALALYDDEVFRAVRPVGTQLCNTTALLWRLETLGCEAGDRWAKQSSLWQQQANGICSPFNEIHAAMTALRAGETGAYEVLLSGMREAAAAGGELAPTYRDVAVPIVEALASFVKDDYADTVDRLLPVEASLWRMGGSIAQRDLIEWTLTEAAIRAGLRDVALSLTNERLSLRPDSAVNRHFLEEARAIGA